MIFYFFVFFILIISDIFHFKSKIYWYITFIILGVFLCMGYMTGSDWRGYEIEYNEVLSKNIWEGNTEYGFLIYMYIFKYLGFDFWHFFIVTKWILFLIIFKFIDKNISDNKYFTYAIFFALYGIFLFIDNPMRNLIGAVIYLFSFKYIVEENFFKYLITCLLASLFHLSFLLFIPIFFLLNKKIKSKTYVIGFIFFNIILFFFSDQIINGVKLLEIFNISYSIKLDQQISGYIMSDNIKDAPFSFGMLSRYIIFIILIMYRNLIESYSKNGRLIFNSSIFLIFLTRLVLIWPITLRLSIPFSVFYTLSLSIIILKSKKEITFFLYSFLLLISTGTIYTTITSSIKYIPYSNYIEYLFVYKPDYNYRSNYNFDKSPYKNK